MDTVFAVGVTNVVVAAMLALGIFSLSRVCRRPALLHGLWVVVLLKLLAPPLIPIPLFAPETIVVPAKTVAKAESPVSAPPTLVARGPENAVDVQFVPAPRFQFKIKPGPTPQTPILVLEEVFEPQPLPPVAPAPPPVATQKPQLTQVAEAASASPFPWQRLLMWLWLGGAIVCLSWMLVTLLRFQNLLRHGERAPDGIQYQLHCLASRMGLRRTPEAWLLPGPLPPLIWATFGRARLYFPRDLLARLDDEGRASLLVHELAHVRRRDHWVRWLELLVAAAYWWCPLVWWVRGRLRACEEACCDAWVVEMLSPRAYAGAILETVDFLAGAPALLPVAASGLGRVETLKRRLLAIMDRQYGKGLSWLGRFALLAFACALPVMPTRANPIYEESPAEPVVQAEKNKPLARSSLRGQLLMELNFVPPQEQADFSPGTLIPLGKGEPLVAATASPDGSVLALADESRTVMLRDALTGELLQTLAGHDDVVTCLAFSPDGRTLATGSPDRMVCIWDVATGETRAILHGHRSWVYAVAFSPDGKTLATAGYDRTIRLWRVGERFAPAGVLEGHTASIRALAFAPNNQTLASGGSDREVIVWDLASQGPRFRLTGHEGAVRNIAFSPGGNSLASASEDGTVRIWNGRDGKLIKSLSGHKGGVHVLAYRTGGKTLATGGNDGTVRVWDVATGQAKSLVHGLNDPIVGVAFATDGHQLYSAGLDRSLRRWTTAAPAWRFDQAAIPLDVQFAPPGPEVREAFLIDKNGVPKVVRTLVPR